MKTQTKRAIGEKWPHPGDVGELRPGVSASVIHPAGAPHPGFTSGGFGVESSQPWMPLARRVCLDRVLHVMLEATSLFASARAEGSTGKRLKVEPWNHMNPYHIGSEYLGMVKVKVGVTDHWKNDRQLLSTSGANMYVQGTPGAADALRTLCSLLEEADVDVPNDRSAALLLRGGGGVWGTDPKSNAQGQLSAWAQELGLPPLLQTDVARAADPGQPWAELAEADAGGPSAAPRR